MNVTFRFPFQIAHSHIVSNFQRAKLPLCFFLLLKKARKFIFHFFVASLLQRYYNKSRFICQALFSGTLFNCLACQNHYTTIKAYFLNLVKHFFIFFLLERCRLLSGYIYIKAFCTTNVKSFFIFTWLFK